MNNNTYLLCSSVHFYLLHDFYKSREYIDLSFLENYIFNLFCDVYGGSSDCLSFEQALSIVMNSSSYCEYLCSHNFG